MQRAHGCVSCLIENVEWLQKLPKTARGNKITPSKEFSYSDFKVKMEGVIKRAAHPFYLFTIYKCCLLA